MPGDGVCGKSTVLCRYMEPKRFLLMPGEVRINVSIGIGENFFPFDVFYFYWITQ
jgi:hypothetical protein